MISDGKTKLLLSLDDRFPDRALKMSFYVSLMIVFCSLSYLPLMGTVSVAVGCCISLILYKMLWWTVRYAVQHKRSEIKGFFLKVSLAKYGIVGAMLLSTCLCLEVNVIALALGLSVVLIVIVAKIGSKLLVDYMNASVKVSSQDIGGISANAGKKGV